ncbi:MAG TPA: hypothetical protein VKE69_01035 [Planctomycetota bacterium]|nr:hypothetical protein [Planctomycetota bacterium]
MTAAADEQFRGEMRRAFDAFREEIRERVRAVTSDLSARTEDDRDRLRKIESTIAQWTHELPSGVRGYVEREILELRRQDAELRKVDVEASTTAAERIAALESRLDDSKVLARLSGQVEVLLALQPGASPSDFLRALARRDRIAPEAAKGDAR